MRVAAMATTGLVERLGVARLGMSPLLGTLWLRHVASKTSSEISSLDRQRGNKSNAPLYKLTQAFLISKTNLNFDTALSTGHDLPSS
jgi:hypothetical protein